MADLDLLDVAIAPSSALGSHVLDRLRRLIITQEIKAGTHLVESQLSRSFDVSRGPIRDALKQLENEGLVEARRRGMYVVGLSEDDIDELYSLRELIELHAITRAMTRKGSDWAPAQHHLDQMGTAVESGDAHAFARADLLFHSALYEVAGHRRLSKVWNQYEPTFAVLLDLTNAQDRDLHPTLRDHENLLSKAKAGDQKIVQKLVAEHMAGSRSRLLAAHRKLTAD